jgi:uncharacterized DUF497 family protein
MAVEYSFEWDPNKERVNRQKHKVGFRQAASVFRDPNQLTIYDEDHSHEEERWLTIGLDAGGTMRVISHTFEQLDADTVKIRIISARKAVGDEIVQYETGT